LDSVKWSYVHLPRDWSDRNTINIHPFAGKPRYKDHGSGI